MNKIKNNGQREFISSLKIVIMLSGLVFLNSLKFSLFGADLDLIWRVVYDFGTSSNPHNVIVDENGVYVSGAIGNYGGVVKLDKTDGSILWQYTTNLTPSTFSGMAADESYLYVAGSYNTQPGTSNLLVEKISKNGARVAQSHYNYHGYYSSFQDIACDESYFYAVGIGGAGNANWPAYGEGDIWDKTSWTLINHWALCPSSAQGWCGYLAVTCDANFLFLSGVDNSSPRLEKRSKSSGSLLGSWPTNTNLYHICNDEDYVYLGGNQLQKWSKDGSQMGSTASAEGGIAIAGDYLYIGRDPWVIEKRLKSDLSFLLGITASGDITNIAFDSLENCIYAVGYIVSGGHHNWVIEKREAEVVGVKEVPMITYKHNGNLKIYPNPFRSKTEILFEFPLLHSMHLKIYGGYGKLVRDFSRATHDGHTMHIVWDGTDDSGCRLPPGVYFVRLETEGFKQVEKVIILR